MTALLCSARCSLVRSRSTKEAALSVDGVTARMSWAEYQATDTLYAAIAFDFIGWEVRSVLLPFAALCFLLGRSCGCPFSLFCRRLLNFMRLALCSLLSAAEAETALKARREPYSSGPAPSWLTFALASQALP